MVETTSQLASLNFNWRALLRLVAVAYLIALVATAIALDDLLAAVLAAVVLLGLALLRFRSGWFGVALLGLVFAEPLIWTLSGAVSNILRGERFVAIIIPSALATISLAGVTAAGAVVIHRRDPSAGEKWAPRIGSGAAILFALFIAASFFVRGEGQPVVRPTDISLEAENMAFSSDALVANTGEITVRLDNHDLWWHTFTIGELGVNLQVPMGANQQITFHAPPGTYRYYCAIPGHEDIGMHGTLTVKEAGQDQGQEKRRMALPCSIIVCMSKEAAVDTSPNPSDGVTAGGDPAPREGVWAKPMDRLRVSGLPEGALNLNVEGRHITGPLQGFGQLWQKTYRVRLSGVQVTPVQVIKTWLENFPQFWPKGNRFYAPLIGIQPGAVAILNLAGPGGITGPGGMPLISTGVMVIYADEESFSFMTPEGHPFAAMITFSANEDEGATVAQIQALVRANDPLYELSLRLGFGHKSEDEFWQGTLLSLARYFGVESVVQQQTAVIDSRIQWYQAKNIWHNAAIRTGLYAVGAPLRWVRGAFNKK